MSHLSLVPVEPTPNRPFLEMSELRWSLVVYSRRAWSLLSLAIVGACSGALASACPGAGSVLTAAGVTAVVAGFILLMVWLRTTITARSMEQRLQHLEEQVFARAEHVPPRHCSPLLFAPAAAGVGGLSLHHTRLAFFAQPPRRPR